VPGSRGTPPVGSEHAAAMRRSPSDVGCRAAPRGSACRAWTEGVLSCRANPGALRCAEPGAGLEQSCAKVACVSQPFDNVHATALQEGDLLEWSVLRNTRNAQQQMCALETNCTSRVVQITEGKQRGNDNEFVLAGAGVGRGGYRKSMVRVQADRRAVTSQSTDHLLLAIRQVHRWSCAGGVATALRRRGSGQLRDYRPHRR